MHGAHHVDFHHDPEFLQAHLGEALVAQDARVVHQDIDTAPARHGRVHHRLDLARVGHIGAVRAGVPAGRAYGVRHGLRRRAGLVGSHVVDQHLGAVTRQFQRVSPAKAAPRSGHDGDAPLQKLCHRFSG
ncbi:hypothetical protein D3C72_2005990 [compost metagenome]